MNQEPEGVSTRSLLGAFFAVVVLCAVFFSLGFFLGNRQAHATSTLATEQVSSTSDVPPAVNPSSPSTEPATSSAPDDPATSSEPAAAPVSQNPDSRETQATSPPTPAETTPSPKPGSEEPVSPDSLTVARVPPGILVQVAAVTNKQDAANVAALLRSKNYRTMILTPAQVKAKDNYYRVVSGPYKTRADAEKARTELTAEGFKPFIR